MAVKSEAEETVSDSANRSELKSGVTETSTVSVAVWFTRVHSRPLDVVTSPLAMPWVKVTMLPEDIMLALFDGASDPGPISLVVGAAASVSSTSSPVTRADIAGILFLFAILCSMPVGQI
jgi:hypothetical protein